MAHASQSLQKELATSSFPVVDLLSENRGDIRKQVKTWLLLVLRSAFTLSYILKGGYEGGQVAVALVAFIYYCLCPRED